MLCSPGSIPPLVPSVGEKDRQGDKCYFASTLHSHASFPQGKANSLSH